MKTAIKYFSYIGICLVTMFFTGCVTPEKTAYRSLATISVTVDTSMKVWGTWVAQGKATPADEAVVRKSYSIYQSSMKVAQAAVVSINSSPSGQSNLNVALNAVADSASTLVQLVQTITQKP